MKRIALILFSMIAIASCKDEPVDPKPGPETGDGKGVSLNIHIPKNSLSTYSSEDASTLENFIDTIYIDLYQGATLINQSKFSGSELIKQSGSKDSIVNVAYEVDNITTGTLSVKVYANSQVPKQLASGSEVPLPRGSTDRSTSFYMSGTTTLSYSDASYKGEVHLVRNVAKLRINVSPNSVVFPSDLIINYDSIKIEVIQTPDITSAFNNEIDVSGVTYITNTARTGTNLRKSTSFSSTNGGQIDSLYLYENFRSSYTESNKTKIKITIPTESQSEGNRPAPYTYTLHTPQTGFSVLRNYIYILNIKVRGQSLEPLITLDITPWNDVSISGDILGTNLTMDVSEILFDENGQANINFCTDAQAIYFNFEEFDDANQSIAEMWHTIDPIGIEPADVNLAPDGFKDGQILLDKQHCGSFGFHLNLNDYLEFPNVNFSGRICMKAGNIVKCLTFPARNLYDAHFIVGEEILNGEAFKNATIVEDNGAAGWLKISTTPSYSLAGLLSSYSGTATKLYLQLDENLSGATRTGSITLVNGFDVEKKINISQLSAIPIGRFGYTNGSNIDDSIYSTTLYAEQLYEFSTRPAYNSSSSGVIIPNNALYNGRYPALSTSVFDWANYQAFNYQAAAYEAINYCAHKNRITGTSNLQTELKWYLPAQAQLMAMWISFHAMDTTFSNFATKDTYWSATDNYDYPDQVQYIDFRHGNVGHYNKLQKYWARCVRDGATATNSMITLAGTSPNNYTLIDFSAGMPPGSTVNTSKTNNATGDEWSNNNNTLYYKLRVANTDASTATAWSATICSGYSEGDGATGWRLPTQRELQAIWILQYELNKTHAGFNLLGANYYWSATTSASASTNRWVVYGLGSRSLPGSSGNVPNRLSTDNTVSVRCVREMP